MLPNVLELPELIEKFKDDPEAFLQSRIDQALGILRTNADWRAVLMKDSSKFIAWLIGRSPADGGRRSVLSTNEFQTDHLPKKNLETIVRHVIARTRDDPDMEFRALGLTAVARGIDDPVVLQKCMTFAAYIAPPALQEITPLLSAYTQVMREIFESYNRLDPDQQTLPPEIAQRLRARYEDLAESPAGNIVFGTFSPVFSRALVLPLIVLSPRQGDADTINQNRNGSVPVHLIAPMHRFVAAGLPIADADKQKIGQKFMEIIAEGIVARDQFQGYTTPRSSADAFACIQAVLGWAGLQLTTWRLNELMDFGGNMRLVQSQAASIKPENCQPLFREIIAYTLQYREVTDSARDAVNALIAANPGFKPVWESTVQEELSAQQRTATDQKGRLVAAASVEASNRQAAVDQELAGTAALLQGITAEAQHVPAR